MTKQSETKQKYDSYEGSDRFSSESDGWSSEGDDEKQEPYLSDEDEGYKPIDDRATGEKVMAAVHQVVPSLVWIPNYKREYLRGDIIAGLTTGVMLLPQGFAYALIAGLSPLAGLYAAFIPPIVYALFGSSRQLSVAPVAMVSLLTYEAVHAIAGEDEALRWELAIVLMLQSGLIQVLMGFLRLGFIVNMLSKAVIVGFTSAAALIIGSSQVKHIWGTSIPRGTFYDTVYNIFDTIPDINWPTLLLGVLCMITIFLLQTWKQMDHWSKKIALYIPASLVVVVLSTAFAFAYHEDYNDTADIKVVGKIDSGLPEPGFPSISSDDFWALFSSAGLISLIGFMESVSVAKAFAEKNGYEIDPNQELVGLGMANIVGSFFKGYPVTGGFSRTAVNAQAGSTTPLASIISGVVVMIALLALTPLVEYLPNATLGAIVLMAVYKLVEIQHMIQLWRVNKKDFAVMMVTFTATLIIGIELGIAVGVGISVVLLVYRSVNPFKTQLGLVEGEGEAAVYRSLTNYPHAKTFRSEGIVIVRFDASLFFANASAFRKMVLKHTKLISPKTLSKYGRIFVIVDASTINDIDFSALEELQKLAFDMAEKRQFLLLAHCKNTVSRTLAKAHFDKVMNEHHLSVFTKFWSVQEAVGFARSAPHDVFASNGGGEGEGDESSV